MSLNLHGWGNLIEAGVWFVVAGVVAWRAKRPGLAVAVMLFGVSDLVEIWSGAWWRPWWLLVWKAACLAVMVPAALGAVRAGRSTSPRK